jgi:WD repeat and SOF domain-containing protein 1
MRVATISRSDDFARERTGDIFKVHRNLDPNLHPMQKAREYTRALRHTKMERLFAKPFLNALSGHIDGVYCMAKHPTKLTQLLSGIEA